MVALYFPCVPGSQIKSMQWCSTSFTYIVKISLDCWEDPTGWFLFLNIIIKILDLFQFQVVSNSKYSDWWFKLMCFCNYDFVLDLKHCLSLINTYSYSFIIITVYNYTYSLTDLIFWYCIYMKQLIHDDWLIDWLFPKCVLYYIVESSFVSSPSFGVLLLVHPWVYPLLYLDLYTDATAENKWSIYFISSKPVELFVHCCGPSAWATPPEWGGKPMTTPNFWHPMWGSWQMDRSQCWQTQQSTAWWQG